MIPEYGQVNGLKAQSIGSIDSGAMFQQDIDQVHRFAGGCAFGGAVQGRVAIVIRGSGIRRVLTNEPADFGQVVCPNRGLDLALGR